VTALSASTNPSLDVSPEGLPGIGPRRASAYVRAGLPTRRHLLYHLPHALRERPAAGPIAALSADAPAAVCGRVLRTSVRRRGRRATVSVRLACEDGELTALLFNRAWLAKRLRGHHVWMLGRLGDESRLLVTDHEVVDPAATSWRRPRWLPVYRLPVGVPPRVHRRAVATLLEQGVVDWRAREPALREADLPSLGEALATVHAPTDRARAERARARLVADEALALSLDVVTRRLAREHERAPAIPLDARRHRALVEALPFTPTSAQARVVDEVRADLGRPVGGRPMARLLQGDVGSGKTLVALYALLAVARAGRQAALMAPTEILAAQHARTLRTWVGPDGPPVVLVAGRPGAAERRARDEALASGSAAIAVGTHGLQSAGVRFADLALTIVDEQHRFGVRQRARLVGKGSGCHLLVMTATPIPRTLALTTYGDLDVSVIDELPPGRGPRETASVPPDAQPGLWRELAAAIARGERGYVVCPTIGERGGEQEEVHSVARTARRVQRRLGRAARVGAVHGRLPPDERDAVLDAFRAGELDVLVATVLVEVGLDVPEATFVVVPDPSRFGLATLHQIRGRVGRGARPGRCWLLEPYASETARRRVEALVRSEDGFALAEDDLRLRGPGEVLGLRQSGTPGVMLLDPVRDVGALADARERVLRLARERSPRRLAALRERAFPRPAADSDGLGFDPLRAG